MAAAAVCLPVSPNKPDEETQNTAASLPVSHSNYVPARMDKHIDFIDFNQTGQLVIGASCLTERYWTGSLWQYKDPKDAPAPEKSLTGVDIHTGVVDGRCVGGKGDPILIALDSGGLEMAHLTSEEQEGKMMFYLESQSSPVDHDDIITGLDTWTSSSTALAATVSHDLSIKLWSPDLTVVRTYSHAHSRPPTSVSCHAYPHLLVTAAMDDTARVWDTRQVRPAVVVYRSSSVPPSMVSWQPGQENCLLVGSFTGGAWLQDIRAPRAPPTVTPLMDRAVRKARWAGHDANMVAVAGDDNVVKVLNVGGDVVQEMYTDTRHSDYVRGLAWHPQDNTLWTAGWDHKILQHIVT